jgi:hypothetical protein
MSDEDCMKDIVRSRERTAPQALQSLESLVKRQRMIDLADEMRRVQQSLQAKERAFVPHPVVGQFMAQFQPALYGEEARRHCLLLVGDSRQGKSSKAMNLFSIANTLKVSCQGLAKGVLPSLADFDRAKHRAIVWDEVRPDQILSNRELFQSNQYTQTLGQSACGQYAYKVWVYFTAMILCANDFPMDSRDTSAGDSEWLRSNLMVAELAPGQRWYLSA